ncbi:PAB1-binding protein 1 [Monosporozyma servazzii]
MTKNIGSTMKPTYKKKENGSTNNIPTNSTFFESGETTKQYNDRLDYLLVNSIGHNVKVTVASGIQYSGLLMASNLESKDGIDIILHNPQTLDGEDVGKLDLESNGNLLIHGADVMELELNKIDLNLDDSKIAVTNEVDAIPPTPVEKPIQLPNDSTKKQSFKTDVAISGNNKPLKERELQKWVPDELPLDSNSTLKDSPPQTLEESSGAWDQFSVNEQKFGVKSTYDEHFYTTKINKNNPNYQERLKEAQRLAEEIENQGTSGNIHVAEDRGIIIDDSGMDEEDLYSGVDRRGDELLASLKKVNIASEQANKENNVNKANKYLPPTLRSQPHHTDPAIISSTTVKNEAVVPNIPIPTQSPKVEAKDAKDAKEKSKNTKENTINPAKPNLSRKESLTHESRASRTLHNHHNNARESPKPRIPLPSSKEAQIEELKKFSEKFKVPYKVPRDMKRVEIKSPQQSGNAKSVKKDSSVNSPNDAKITPRRRQQGSFFGTKKSHTGNKKDLFNKNFNFFTKTKQLHDEEKEMEPFFIEKPYFTAPTWNGTVEESFKNFFPDEGTAIQQAQVKLQQRQMSMNGGAMNTATAGMMGMNNNGMMFSGAGASGPNMGGANMRMNNAAMMGFPGQSGMNPMMNGFPGQSGMYVPFQPQPMFYPNMGNPMMPMMGAEDVGSNPPSQTTSPQVPHVYMNTAAPPFGFAANGPSFHPMSVGANNSNNNNRERGGHYYGHRGPRNNSRNAAHPQT